MWVVGPDEFRISPPSTINNKPFFQRKKKVGLRPHVEPEKILSLDPQKLEPRVGDTSTPYVQQSGLEYSAVPGGGGVLRLSLS